MKYSDDLKSNILQISLAKFESQKELRISNDSRHILELW